jgi:hypothetical protein
VIHRDAAHPAVVRIGRESALLKNGGRGSRLSEVDLAGEDHGGKPGEDSGNCRVEEAVIRVRPCVLRSDRGDPDVTAATPTHR